MTHRPPKYGNVVRKGVPVGAFRAVIGPQGQVEASLRGEWQITPLFFGAVLSEAQLALTASVRTAMQAT